MSRKVKFRHFLTELRSGRRRSVCLKRPREVDDQCRNPNLDVGLDAGTRKNKCEESTDSFTGKYEEYRRGCGAEPDLATNLRWPVSATSCEETFVAQLPKNV